MRLTYIPALDGIRTLAVGLVILLHWPYTGLQLPFGWAGVNVFFVLSGFLITRILLEAKEKPLPVYLKHFYRNRFLRIFPLYYAYMFLISAFLLIWAGQTATQNLPEVIVQGVEALKKDLWFLVTYTYNFKESFQSGSSLAGHKTEAQNSVPFFSHLWSLAIEEQYYLVFPFLVFFLTRRALTWVLAGLFLLTPLLRLAYGEFYRSPGNEELIGLILTKLTFFHLDGFALGGLLTLLPFSRIRKPERWLALFGLVLILSGIILTWYLRKNGIEIGRKSLGLDHPLYQYMQQPDLWLLKFRYAFTYTLVNLFSALLLLTVLQENAVSRFFSHRLLVFTGKLTYGIYIFHFPVLAFFRIGLSWSGVGDGGWQNSFLEFLLFPVYILLVIIIAWLSYRFYETFFLQRKSQLEKR